MVPYMCVLLTGSIKTVYVKKFLRKFGLDIEFDWPAEMITVSSCSCSLLSSSVEHLATDPITLACSLGHRRSGESEEAHV